MSKWFKRFIGLAQYVAQWSKDPSTKVGAVIVDFDNRIVSLGFNGFPRGTSDDLSLYTDRDRKYRRVIHAEKNAMSFAKRDLRGCTLYVTHAPCAQCAAQIVQEGISRVICPSPWDNADYISRWESDVVEMEALFDEAGVELEYE